jgi:MazG family protein
MHSHLANEREAFTFEQVVETVCEKLIRRHPHVFGDTSAEDSQQVLKQWEQIKRQEKGGDASVLAGLPAALPALMRAQNAQKKAARVGFDWESAAPVYEKIEEEMAEVREAVAQGDAQAVEEEIGDLLFSVVNLARKLKVDSETALTSATGKFVTRFQAVEAALAQTGRKIEEATPEEMNQLWDEHKRAVSAQ